MIFVTANFLVQLTLHLRYLIAMSAVIEPVFAQVLHHTLVGVTMPQLEQILLTAEKTTSGTVGFSKGLTNEFSLLRPVAGIGKTDQHTDYWPRTQPLVASFAKECKCAL